MRPDPDPRRAVTDRPPRLLQPTRGFAAVALVMSHGLERGWEVLFIRRAEHPRDPWSGHIAFPGGRVEAQDRDPLEAAIRETREEIGLLMSPSDAVGPLDDLAAVGGRPGLVIRPYVFHLDAIPEALSPNDEVASIHRVSLDRLLSDEGRGTMTWQRGEVSLVLPCVDFDGQRLWGLTLRMVDDLLDRIDGRGIGTDRIRTSSAG